MVFLDRAKPDDLFPIIQSLAVSQLSLRREPWDVKNEAAEWSIDDSLDEKGIGLDSFDLLSLAQQVNEQFFLHELAIEDYLLARRSFAEWGELILHAWLNVARPKIQFSTSGTMGKAKQVDHYLEAIEEEVLSLLEFLPPAERVLGYAPPHHIYGFIFEIMMPVIEGSERSLHYLNQVRFDPRPGDRIVSIPSLWALLTRKERLPEKLHGTSSTAPLEPQVARSLSAKGLDIYEIYGSTESSGVGVRCNPDEPFQLLPYWQRHPSQPRRLSRSLLGNPGENEKENLEVELMDSIEWISERQFLPQGRVDEVVQVGGYNVSLQAVAERLKTCPLVEECAVRLMSPEEGERLKAFVVPAQPAAESSDIRRRIEDFCADEFASHERPAHISIGEKLPTGPLGKIKDWSLLQ